MPSRRQVLVAAMSGFAATMLAGCIRPGGDGATPRPESTPHRERERTHHDGGHGGHGGPSGTHHRRSPHGQTTADSGTGSLDQWLSNADTYTGVVDRTDEETVTVRVGVEGNGGYNAFAPPAIRVSRGTTVRWTWTGSGGAHNVVAVDGDFESRLTASADEAFSHTFETVDTHRYYCQPHRSLGMKGAVVVV